MKKYFALMFALVLCFALAGTALADGEFATGGDLYQHWYSTYDYENDLSPYPDYVCGVWTESGDMFTQLTIMVTKDEAGEVGKQEILALVEDDDTVDFIYGTYTHAQLRAVQEEIGEIMQSFGFQGSAGWGVDESENVVTLDIDSETEGALKVIDTCYTRFGDRIVVNDVRGLAFTNDTMTVGVEEQGYDIGGLREEVGMERTSYAWLVLPVLLLGLGTAAVLLRRRAVKYAPVEGETVELLTGTEAKVRDASHQPSPELDRKILSEIDKL